MLASGVSRSKHVGNRDARAVSDRVRSIGKRVSGQHLRHCRFAARGTGCQRQPFVFPFPAHGCRTRRCGPRVAAAAWHVVADTEICHDAAPSRPAGADPRRHRAFRAGAAARDAHYLARLSSFSSFGTPALPLRVDAPDVCLCRPSASKQTLHEELLSMSCIAFSSRYSDRSCSPRFRKLRCRTNCGFSRSWLRCCYWWASSRS